MRTNRTNDIFRQKHAGTSSPVLPSKSPRSRQQQKQQRPPQQQKARSAVPLEEMLQDQLHLNGNEQKNTMYPTHQQQESSNPSAPATESTNKLLSKQQQQQSSAPQPQPKRKKEQKPKHKTVPYFVLDLSSAGKSKALFTVPTILADAMCVNPVVCCGSTFDLEIDILSQRSHRHRQEGVENTAISAEAAKETCFLSTEFYSPQPDQTALEISKRLAIRIEGDGLGMSDGAGGFLAF